MSSDHDVSLPTEEEPAVHPSPLAVPIFRAIWLSSLVSNFGSLIQSVGASWMMTMMGASPQMIALVQAANTLPIMLLSLWAGAVADNLDRRKVMLAAQVFMLMASGLLAVLALADLLTPWLLLMFTLLIAIGTALNGPAWQASVGDMVPRETVSGAVALNSMGFNVARSFGPALGGAIVAVAGGAAAFVVNAVSYVGLIVVLLRWRPAYPPRVLPRERLGVAMMAGLRYAALSPPIRGVLPRAVGFGLTASAVPAMMPLVARDLIAGGPLTYGVLLGGFGVGGVCGAFMGTILRRRLSPEWIVRVATIGMALGSFAAGAGRSLLPTLPGLALAGASWVIAISTFNVSVQMAAPRWVVARALALYQMAVFGGVAIGSWGFGIVADHRGAAVALYVAAAGLLVTAASGFYWRLEPVSDADLDPDGRWTEPPTAVPVDPGSGPICVAIEHRIAEADEVSFLKIMNERQRIRRRDGARHWRLLRDLGDAELWIERFDVPTWLDYVRLNLRRTHADEPNTLALAALRLGPERPIVHRSIERQTGSMPDTPREGPRSPKFEAITDPVRSA